ncbi:MAG: glycosyltransferase [Acidobacteriota bacterium]|nr:glycosyltransferase [Acidobacteriota bacterium]
MSSYPATPSVTVVVATRDRRAELLRSLERLVGLPERPAVVVVDNCSSDGSAAAVRSAFPAVEVIALAANLGAAARNVGLRVASTPLVAFSDDDSWWADGALATAARRFSDDPRLGLLAARVVVGPGEDLDPTCGVMAGGVFDEWLRPSPAGRRAVTGFLACGAVVRRRALLGTGAFEAYMVIGGEEEAVAIDLAAAGWKLIYEPEVTAHHHPSARREADTRTMMTVRNGLLTRWTRYPLRYWPGAFGAVIRAGRARPGPPVRGGLHALGAAGWALSQRRPVPPPLARRFHRG